MNINTLHDIVIFQLYSNHFYRFNISEVCKTANDVKKRCAIISHIIE